MLTGILINACLLPLATAAIVALLLRQTEPQPQLIWAIAPACGFIAAQFGLKSQPSFAAAVQVFIHPHEAADWLPLIVLLSLGVSVLMIAAQPSRWPIAWVAALVVAVPIRLLGGNARVAFDWSAVEKLAYLALLVAVLALIWLLSAIEDDERGIDLRVPLLVVLALGTGVVLHRSGVFVYGLSCGAFAAAISGTALGFFVRPARLKSDALAPATIWQRLSLPGIGGAAGVVTCTLGSLIILGHFSAELTANATLLFVSLAAIGVPLPGAVGRGPAWFQPAARVALCVIPLAIALLRATD